LPFVLIAVVLLFVLPSLRKKHTSGPSAGTIAAETIDAMNLIDKGEQSYKTAHRGFTTASRRPAAAEHPARKRSGDPEGAGN